MHASELADLRLGGRLRNEALGSGPTDLHEHGVTKCCSSGVDDTHD